MGRVATIIIGGQEVTVLNYETDEPIILSSSEDEGHNDSDGNLSASDDGDWRPKGASAKKLKSSNPASGNYTKRNLFKNVDSGIGSDGNSGASGRSSSSEEAPVKSYSKPEKTYRQNTALSRAERANARNEKEFENMKKLLINTQKEVTPVKSVARSPKSFPRVKPMTRPVKQECSNVSSPTLKQENKDVIKVLTSDPKLEQKLGPKIEAKIESELILKNNSIGDSELDEEDLEDWQHEDEQMEPTFKCELYEEDCNFKCFDQEEFKKHVDKVHLGMEVAPIASNEDTFSMDDLPLC